MSVNFEFILKINDAVSIKINGEFYTLINNNGEIKLFRQSKQPTFHDDMQNQMINRNITKLDKQLPTFLNSNNIVL